MSNLLTIQESSLTNIADSIRRNTPEEPETILVRSSNVYTMREYQKISGTVDESHVVDVPGTGSARSRTAREEAVLYYYE